MAKKTQIEKSMLNNFVKQLKQRRLNLGLSQTAVSEKLGYSNSNFVCILESGKTNIPYHQLDNIADIYNLDKGMLSMALIKHRDQNIWKLIKYIIDSDLVKKGMTIEQIEMEVDNFNNNIGCIKTSDMK